MRIIAGSKRGKKLITLEGDKIRPTTDRVKESLFNILQNRIEGRTFLDLFAGSGQIGLEALSRGAEHAYFVESSRQAAKIIQKNILNTDFESVSDLYMGDFLNFFKYAAPHAFDIIYLDPPYHENLFLPALEACSVHVKPTGLIVCEHPADEKLPDQVGILLARKSYRYGKIVLTLYQTFE